MKFLFMYIFHLPNSYFPNFCEPLVTWRPVTGNPCLSLLVHTSVFILLGCPCWYLHMMCVSQGPHQNMLCRVTHCMPSHQIHAYIKGQHASNLHIATEIDTRRVFSVSVGIISNNICNLLGQRFLSFWVHTSVLFYFDAPVDMYLWCVWEPGFTFDTAQGFLVYMQLYWGIFSKINGKLPHPNSVFYHLVQYTVYGYINLRIGNKSKKQQGSGMCISLFNVNVQPEDVVFS